MRSLHYSKINFVGDLTDPESHCITIAIIAEWYDGEFWKMAICASEELRSIDFETLTPFCKCLLEKPFELIYNTVDRYVKAQEWKQTKHTLRPLLAKAFPDNSSLQAIYLFEQDLTEDEDAEHIFDDVSFCVPGKVKKAYWHIIDPTDVTSIDNTKVLE